MKSAKELLPKIFMSSLKVALAKVLAPESSILLPLNVTFPLKVLSSKSSIFFPLKATFPLKVLEPEILLSSPLKYTFFVNVFPPPLICAPSPVNEQSEAKVPVIFTEVCILRESHSAYPKEKIPSELRTIFPPTRDESLSFPIFTPAPKEFSPKSESEFPLPFAISVLPLTVNLFNMLPLAP